MLVGTGARTRRGLEIEVRSRRASKLLYNTVQMCIAYREFTAGQPSQSTIEAQGRGGAGWADGEIAR